jgi:hypothetical protein
MNRDASNPPEDDEPAGAGAGDEAMPAPGAQAAPPGAGSGALSTAADVEALADKLTACADALHERIMAEVRSYRGGPVPARAQDAMRALLDEEQVLRQRANALYLDAAKYIVSKLGKPQQHLMALTADAAEKLKKITRIGDGVSLVARLLGVAGAVVTGQVAPILLSLEALKRQLDLIALHNAPATPKA